MEKEKTRTIKVTCQIEMEVPEDWVLVEFKNSGETLLKIGEDYYKPVIEWLKMHDKRGEEFRSINDDERSNELLDHIKEASESLEEIE